MGESAHATPGSGGEGFRLSVQKRPHCSVFLKNGHSVLGSPPAPATPLTSQDMESLNEGTHSELANGWCQGQHPGSEQKWLSIQDAICIFLGGLEPQYSHPAPLKPA